MASDGLRKKIERLTRKLEALTTLADNPPVLPEGFIIAEVVDVNPSYAPPGSGGYVVVPQRLGQEVRIYESVSGVCAQGNGHNALVEGRWETPEEAIEAWWQFAEMLR